MTTAETAKYNEYVANLTLIRTMMADKRDYEQMMAVFGIKTEVEFLAWVSSMNTYNQNYLKRWAKELRTAGKSIAEISLTIGHTEDYVNLLLNDGRQSIMDGVTTEDTAAEIRKQRAITMANQNMTVKEIATVLSVSLVDVTDKLLGAAYMKSWARRLADDDMPISSKITAIIQKNEAWIKSENGLGAEYLKSWAKRCADNNEAVSAIATKLNVSVTDIRNYLGAIYLNSWAHRLMYADTPLSTITTKLGEAKNTDIWTKYITLTERQNWAKSLVNGGKTVSQASAILGGNTSDVKNLLGNDYMQTWVQSLNAAGRSRADIRSITSLTDVEINNYMKAETDETARYTNLGKSITKSISTTEDTYANIAKRNAITKLVNDGSTITQIKNNQTIKNLWGGKSPTSTEIQTLMGKEFMSSWAKSRILVNSMEQIMKILGYSDQVEVERLLSMNDEDYKKNWAISLANLGKYTVDQIGTWICSKPDRVRTFLGSQYLKNWASNLADGGSSITEIATTLGSGVTTASVRDSYLGSAKIFEILKREIANVPAKDATLQKNVDWLNTFFDIPKNEKLTWVHSKLTTTKGQPRNEYKKWVADLKDRGDSIGEIRKYITADGKTNDTQPTLDYIRDSILGKDTMKAWAIALIHKGGRMMYGGITKQLGLGELDVLNLICDNKPGVDSKSKEIRSWAIRLTKYSDKTRPVNDRYYSAKDIILRMGFAYTIDKSDGNKKKWVRIREENSIKTEHITNFRDFIGYEYCVEWVKNLSNAKIENTENKMYTVNQIVNKTGLTKAMVEKYSKAKL